MASATTASLMLTSSRWPSCTIFSSSSYQSASCVRIEHRLLRHLTAHRISIATKSSALGTTDFRMRRQLKQSTETFTVNWKIFCFPSTKRLKTNDWADWLGSGMLLFKSLHISSFLLSFSSLAFCYGKCLVFTRKTWRKKVSGSSSISQSSSTRRFCSAQLSSPGYPSKWSKLMEKLSLILAPF